MSRTYRKSSITEDYTKVAWENHAVDIYGMPDFTYEYYYSDNALAEYEAALKVYKEKLKEAEYKAQTYPDSDFYAKRLQILRYKEPKKYWFICRRVVPKDVDIQAIKHRAAKEYDSYSRDGKCHEGSVKQNYRKHCAKATRVRNKQLIHKIMKDIDVWEDSIFPDTIDGKQYIWDFW